MSKKMLSQMGSTILGFRGEGINDHRVWVNKSHFPGYSPWDTLIQRGEKVIIVVRNPLDSLVSFLHLQITSAMGVSAENHFNTDFPEFWGEYVDKMSRQFELYHNYWIHLAKTKEYPIIFLKYEDLLSKKKETLVEIFKFLFEVESLEGLYVMDRIEAEISRGKEVSGVVYKPRVGSSLASLDSYTAQQIQTVQNHSYF